MPSVLNYHLHVAYDKEKETKDGDSDSLFPFVSPGSGPLAGKKFPRSYTGSQGYHMQIIHPLYSPIPKKVKR